MISKYMSRVAAFGAAGALAAVALVGIAPSADAAKPLPTNYTCDIVGRAGHGRRHRPAEDRQGKDAKKGIAAKSFTLTITLSEGIAGALRGLTDSVAGSASGVSYTVAGVKKPVAVNNLAIKSTDVGTSGPLVLQAKASGKQGAFKLTKKGTYAYSAPKSFTFTPTAGDGSPLVGDLGCALSCRCSGQGRQPQGQVTLLDQLSSGPVLRHRAAVLGSLRFEFVPAASNGRGMSTDTSITVQRTIDAPTQDVFDVLSNPERHPRSTPRASSSATRRPTGSPAPDRSSG